MNIDFEFIICIILTMFFLIKFYLHFYTDSGRIKRHPISGWFQDEFKWITWAFIAFIIFFICMDIMDSLSFQYASGKSIFYHGIGGFWDPNDWTKKFIDGDPAKGLHKIFFGLITIPAMFFDAWHLFKIIMIAAILHVPLFILFYLKYYQWPRHYYIKFYIQYIIFSASFCYMMHSIFFSGLFERG